ncbi:T9SS type A sorting domain-containing protein [Puteibacter caeruleilacunae]|nr:T9SS type A sorting domain-containing protein [Puteibacter caeruleilacunae]
MKKNTLITLCAGIMLCMLFLYGCTNETPKTALWISHPDFEHSSNQWYQLRKQVSLDGKPDKAVARISADSKYWLWINGDLAVFEGQLKRGPNPNDTYFDEVDLAPWLKDGDNTIAVQLWYFGREGFSHKDSKQAGFFFDCLAEDQQIVSDSTWKINRAKAFQGTEAPQGNYRLPESNLRFVAAEAIEGWQNEDFDDSSWVTASNVGTEGVAPWNNLAKRPIPLFKTYPLHRTTQFTLENNKVVLKLPYNMQYHPYLKVKAPAGKMIRMNPDNLHKLNDVPLRGEYVTKDGEQEYLHLPWLSGHAIHFEFEEGIEVLEVGYMESGYDTEFDGTFEVADDYLMRYFKKAQRTLYVNMRDTYFDCPDRERAQWIGDGTILTEEAFYLLNNKAIDLGRKMYNELFDWQRGDATLYGPIPAGNWGNELPQQILAAVGKYGFGRYFMYTGDDAMMQKAYPHIKKYLDLWKVAEDGTVPFRRGGWTWGDWGSQIDRELSEHVWVYIALDNLAYMANYLGKTDEANTIKAKMAAIKKRVNTVFWTSNGYRSPGYNEETDDRGNALAVVSGIAEQAKYPVIYNLFKKVEHASPYMEKYVMEALFKMGQGKFAIERFKKRYAQMVNHPECTTLWEFWSYGASINHAWSGGPLSTFYKNIAGIQPTKPGFEEFTVFPDPSVVGNVKCKFTTVKGEISLLYAEDGDKVKEAVTVPTGTKAVVRIPKNSGALKVNGGDAKELTASADADFDYYELSAGDWTIEYTKPVVTSYLMIDQEEILEQNYPNPFNASTNITVNLPEVKNSRLWISDLSGKMVKEINTSSFQQGKNEVTFNKGNVTPGIYIYNLLYGKNQYAKKMIVL